MTVLICTSARDLPKVNNRPKPEVNTNYAEGKIQTLVNHSMHHRERRPILSTTLSPYQMHLSNTCIIFFFTVKKWTRVCN